MKLRNNYMIHSLLPFYDLRIKAQMEQLERFIFRIHDQSILAPSQPL